MKLEKGDFGTAIFLDQDEFKKLCRPGAGADTCVWAMVGDRGPECGYYNRHPELVRRWEAGETVAKRDGCDVVKAVEGDMRGVTLIAVLIILAVLGILAALIVPNLCRVLGW